MYPIIVRHTLDTCTSESSLGVIVNAGGLAGMDSLLDGGTKDPKKKKKKKDSLEKILDQL